MDDGLDYYTFRNGIYQVFVQSEELAIRIFKTIDFNFSGKKKQIKKNNIWGRIFKLGGVHQSHGDYPREKFEGKNWSLYKGCLFLITAFSKLIYKAIFFMKI